MDSLQSHDGSPYINDIEFVPPSPSSANHLDLDPHTSPFDNNFAFNNSSNPLGPDTPFAHTPSYNGSYHNSPFSNHSELSFVGDSDISFNLFDDRDPATIQDFDPAEYDPGEYDAPHSGSSLLMFSDDNYMSPGFHSLSSDHQGSRSFDYSSPSSNASANDDTQPGGRHSRASSVSSNHNNVASNPSSASSNPTAHFSASPRLDVAQSFENMTFHSPNLYTDPLPPSDMARHSPQLAAKHTSPPRLLMPDYDQQQPQGQQQAPPTINAPDGDGVMGGPQLHIVPATPISGGGASAAAVPSFQATLETLRQGTPFESRPPSWGVSPDQQQQDNAVDSKPFVFPTHHDGSSPSNNNNNSSSSATTRDDSSLPSNSNNTRGGGGGYLFPTPARTRSKSDTSLEPPNWDTATTFADDRRSALLDEPGTVNMNDVLPHLPMGMMHQQGQGHYPPQLTHGYTFGPPSSSSSNGGPSNNNTNNGGFLSPDPNQSLFPSNSSNSSAVAAANLRRSKSDSGQRPTHNRLSRSEDIRLPPANNTNNNNNLGLHQQQLLHHHHQHTSSGQFLFPPNANPLSQNDFLSTLPLDRHQFLSADRGLGIPVHGTSPVSSGHYRRASSGTRSERGAQAWTGAGGGSGGGGPLLPSPGSGRVSPYPSPNASPRPRYDDLPPPPVSAGYESEIALSGRMGMGVGMGVLGGPGGGGGGAEEAPIVSKPNVTTGRTANASHKRRKQEATFMCPIPGCGSTFTRSFNLKGHIRSHNEEKPFQCHWPGCGKGFARQHDCKRHEQLHTNYRPFTCEGCGKPFARMDALNRHLRSEGGADCARAQESNGGGSGLYRTGNSPGSSHSPPTMGYDLPSSSSGGGGVTKIEESWGMNNGVAV